MRLNDNRRLWIFGVKSFNVGTYRLEGHVSSADDDTIATRDSYYDTFLVGVNIRWLVIFRLIDIDADLFNECRCDDKEDEHDEHYIQHGRKVDLLVAFLFLTATPSSHDLPILAVWSTSQMTRVGYCIEAAG